MYCGTCPYCGEIFRDKLEEIVKTRLMYHMIREHHDELLSERMETVYCRKFGEKTCVKWMVGRKAAYNTRPC